MLATYRRFRNISGRPGATLTGGGHVAARVVGNLVGNGPRTKPLLTRAAPEIGHLVVTNVVVDRLIKLTVRTIGFFSDDSRSTIFRFKSDTSDAFL